MVLYKIFLCSVLFVSLYWDTVCGICCRNRDSLLNPNDPLSSELIKAIYKAHATEGRTESYPFKWVFRRWLEWDNFMVNSLSPVIADKTITFTHKHALIYKRIVNYINSNRHLEQANSSSLSCVFIPEFGYVGDYLNCEVELGFEKPDFHLKCEQWFSSAPYWLSEGPNCISSYCCKTRDALLNQQNPNDSKLVRMVYDAMSSISKEHYHFTWGLTRKAKWTNLVQNKWIPIIANQALTNEKKHQILYEQTIKFLDTEYKNEYNRSLTFCIPEFEWGTLGDYLTCQVQSGATAPSYHIDCAAYFGWTPTWKLSPKPCVQPTESCCTNRDFLLDQSHPESSILVQAFFDAFNPYVSISNYPLFVSKRYRNKWQTIIQTKWIPTIKNSKLSNAQKHQIIFTDSANAINDLGGINKTFLYCIPLTRYGVFGDYLACEDKASYNHFSCDAGFTTEQKWIKQAVPCRPSVTVDYCCANRNALLNEDKPNSSPLVQSLRQALDSNVSDENYPFYWEDYEKTVWLDLIQNVWLPTIGDKSLQTAKKFEKLYEVTVDTIDISLSNNKSIALCVFFNNFGNLGHVLQCEVDKGAKKPDFSLRCLDYFENTPPYWSRPTYPCSGSDSSQTTNSRKKTKTGPTNVCCDTSKVVKDSQYGDVTYPKNNCYTPLNFSCANSTQVLEFFDQQSRSAGTVAHCVDGVIKGYQDRVITSVSCY